jgi:SAM-dependent methyltransferase
MRLKKTGFGADAAAYQKYRKDYPKAASRLLFSMLKARHPAILDVGCGTGKSSELFARKGASIVGCDADKRMLKLARALGLPIRYVSCRAERLPFEEASFDAIVIGTAFHWFAGRKTLREFRRVLKPKGLLFIFWPGAPSGLGQGGSPEMEALRRKYKLKFIPERLMDASSIRKLLASSGFADARSVELPYDLRYTLDERVGRWTTMSTYLALPPRMRKLLLADLRRMYRRQLGGKKAFTIRRAIRVCYGYAR